MLKTETNTPEIEKRALKAFRALFRGRRSRAVFEHGQWWIICDDGAQFSVVDSMAGHSVDGFDFEQVTPGDDE